MSAKRYSVTYGSITVHFGNRLRVLSAGMSRNLGIGRFVGIEIVGERPHYGSDGECWSTPIIELADGTVILGSECWWRPVTKRKP